MREHVVEPVLADPGSPKDSGCWSTRTGIFGSAACRETPATGRKDHRRHLSGGMAWHGGGVPSRAKTRPRWTGQPHTPCAGWPRTSPQAWPSDEVQVAYAIGAAHPVGLFVQTFGTGTVPDAQIQEAITRVFDLRPAAIVAELDLLRPIFAQTAAYDTSDESCRNSWKAPTGRTHSPQPCRVRSPGRGREKADGATHQSPVAFSPLPQDRPGRRPEGQARMQNHARRVENLYRFTELDTHPPGSRRAECGAAVGQRAARRSP